MEILNIYCGKTSKQQIFKTFGECNKEFNAMKKGV